MLSYVATGLGFSGPGFRVEGTQQFRVLGLGCFLGPGVRGSGFRAPWLGFRGLGRFRVWVDAASTHIVESRICLVGVTLRLPTPAYSAGLAA